MERISWPRVAACASVLLLALIVVPSAGAADTALSQGFEGGLNGWTTSGNGFWHQKTNPQSVSVKSPEINPALVTIPSGQLPSAHTGSGVAWFGEDSTGTFCGSDFASELSNNTPKSGCNSTQIRSGDLISPSFDLAGAQSAILRFHSWWEIEAKDADRYDKMSVQYSTNGGSTWTPVGLLNPANNPAGAHDQSYSNDGLLAEPEWKQYLVDLSPAIGSANVKVKFNLDTYDAAYNGFRGWLIDDVVVSTPFDAGAPLVTSVTTCQGLQPAPIWVAHGSNFVQGSKVYIDGAQSTKASIPASDRIELPAGNAGQHTIRVVSPNGTTQSNTFSFGAGDCANQLGGPSGAEKRPTRTQVFCNYQVLEATDTCTATVGDATGGGTIPTGTVVFSRAAGGLAAGTACQLQRTPLSTVSACTVEGIRVPKTQPLGITGTYSGDDKLQPSSGQTQFLFAAPGTGAYLQHIEPWNGSNFGSGGIGVTVDNPVDGTDVEADGSVSANGNVCSSGLGNGGGIGGRAAAAMLSTTPATDSGLTDDAFASRSSKGRKLPKIPGFKSKKIKIKKIVVVKGKKKLRNAKKGKSLLKVKFNKRKLVKLFGKKKQVKVVVRVTLKLKNGKVAIINKVLTVKRKGGKGKASFVVVKPSAAAVTGGATATVAQSRGGAHKSQAQHYQWSAQDGCSSLVFGANVDGAQAIAGVNWQGNAACTDGTSVHFTWAPPEIPTQQFPVQGGINYSFSKSYQQEGYPFRISQGFNISGNLNNNGGTATGSTAISMTTPVQTAEFHSRACSATPPPALARTQ